MNSTNDDPEEKNEAQEESEAIEQEHEVEPLGPSQMRL